MSEKCDYVFGVREMRPLHGFPPGRVKIRMRGTEYARAFVKGDGYMREFSIEQRGGYFVPCCEMAANYRDWIKS